MSNDTRWPSARLRIPAASTAVAWTNTSLAPPSGEMKPKPLAELKNFTVPMVMYFSSNRYLARTHAHACERRNQVGKVGCLSQARNEYESGCLTVALHLTDAIAGPI